MYQLFHCKVVYEVFRILGLSDSSRIWIKLLSFPHSSDKGVEWESQEMTCYLVKSLLLPKPLPSIFLKYLAMAFPNRGERCVPSKLVVQPSIPHCLGHFQKDGKNDSRFTDEITVGRVMVPKDVHTLMPRTCEYTR